MKEPIRISAKHLGEVALAEFCPRCFWIKLRLRNRLPFQIFPGIFSSINAYSKRVVHGWFDTHHCCPHWLKNLGVLSGYREPPHYSKFMLFDQTSNILLTGSPDGVFIRADQSHVIIDYKTATYTGTQDQLYPMYEAQLNAYALIGEQCGLTPVSALALVYTEPITDDEAAVNGVNHRDTGFVMGFQGNVHDVPLNSSLIAPLLAHTREIYDLPKSPTGCSGCKIVSS